MSLKKRWNQHKDNRNTCYSKQLMGFEDARMELVEEIVCESITTLRQREQWYLDNHPSCNNCNAYGLDTERAKEYIKEYNKTNIKRRQESSKKHYKANTELVRERAKEYKKANKDKIKEQKRQYYKANMEKINEQKRQYYEANRDKIKEYETANREHINELQRIRRAKLE